MTQPRGGTRRLKVGQDRPQQQQPGTGTRRLKVGQRGDGGAQPGGGGRGLGLGTIRLGAQSRIDSETVFVAGATGRLGARIVRQLLLQGFKCASQ